MQIASFLLPSIVEAMHGRCRHAGNSAGDVRIDQIITDSRDFETAHSAIFVALGSR